MRYERNENTYILGNFNSGDSVTITIYKLSDNTVVVNGASCSEIGSTGVFKYLFSDTITEKEEYLWIMSDGSYSQYGKIILGGWMDSVKEKIDDNLDVAVSTRSSHSAGDVDTQLSSSHGSGSWEGTTPSDIWNYSNRKLTHGELVSDGTHIATSESLSQHDSDIKSEIDDLPSDINSTLSLFHGSGSWEGSTPAEIDNYLSGKHGKGSWEGGGGGFVIPSTERKSPWTHYLRDKLLKLTEEIKSVLLEFREETSTDLDINKKLIRNNYKLIKNIYEQLIYLIQDLQKSADTSHDRLANMISILQKNLSSLKEDLKMLDSSHDLKILMSELDDLIKLMCKELSDEVIDEFVQEFEKDTASRIAKKKKKSRG